MSTPELEPLSQDLKELLQAERSLGFPAVPPQVANEVFAGLASMALPPVGPVAPAGPVAPTAPAVPAALAPVANSMVSAAKTAIAGKLVAVSMISFALGSATGAGVALRMSRPEAPAAVHLEAPVAEPTLQPPPQVPPPAQAEPPAATLAKPAPLAPTTPRPPVAESQPAVTPQGDEELAQERQLLEMARSALARGRYETALEHLEKHALRFASGQLVEERELMALQALAGLGRTPEARERADRFRRNHPDSLLLPAVEAIAANANSSQ